MKCRRFRSFAKINLGLEVIGKLPAGYHELRTLFATLSLHDIVEIAETRAAGVSVQCDHPGVPDDQTNLAYRAAMLMRRMSGRKAGIAITIEKCIPVGGGLGGGSSNAATVLRALDLIWGLGLGPDGLVNAARTLGADVPYFLSGGPALGTGRGDDIRPLDVRLNQKVLLVPRQGGVSTATVFRRFAASGGASGAASPIEAFLRSVEALSTGRKPWALHTLRNDLERAAGAESPSLAAIARRVRGVGRSSGAVHTAMSGSGASFFLLFDEATAARAAAEALRQLGIGSVRCTFLSRRSYVRRFEIKASA